MGNATAGLATVARQVLDVLLPPRCLACGVVVNEPGALCTGCWSGVGFLGPPCCAVCGYPFELDPGEPVLCAACLRRPPPYRRARAVMRYDDASRPLLLGFKHADRTDAAPAFSRWLARAGSESLAEADLIVPVPLHRFRLLRRGYNQAALLAMELAAQTRVPAQVDALVRRRATAPQGHFDGRRRHANVRGAFAVSHPAAIAGRGVVLVDDVLTTGATVAECSRSLLAAGARWVDVLAIAKVIRPQI